SASCPPASTRSGSTTNRCCATSLSAARPLPTSRSRRNPHDRLDQSHSPRAPAPDRTAALRRQARAGDRALARVRNARVQGVRHASDPPGDDRARDRRLMRTRRIAREEEATLVEHLEELRGRVMLTVATVAVATAVAFGFHGTILDLLARPLPPAHRHVTALGVADPLPVP